MGFLGLGLCFKNIFMSTHIAQEYMFSIFPSILTFNFDQIYGLFLFFGAHIGYFGGWNKVQNLFSGVLI